MPTSQVPQGTLEFGSNDWFRAKLNLGIAYKALGQAPDAHRHLCEAIVEARRLLEVPLLDRRRREFLMTWLAGADTLLASL